MTPTDDPLLIELAKIVGPTHVLSSDADTAPYTADWRRTYPGAARCVARPASTDEVSRVVAVCAAHGAPVVPQGGNTGLVGGSTPDDSRREVVMSLQRMHRVRQIDALNMSLTLEAGCTVLAAQEAAAGCNRLFALSLASEGSATVGGVVSTNAGGEQVLRYGNAREQTLGLEVVLPDGRVLDLSGALRKDNTGYDLKQLFIGGEGTLGVVTAATFRLFAAPRQVVTAWVALRDPHAAVELLSRLSDAVGERVTAFELIGREALAQVLRHATPGMRAPLADDHHWSVLFDVCETSGLIDPRPAVEDLLSRAMEDGLVLNATLAASETQAAALWHLREHIPEAQRLEGASLKHDISVSVSQIPSFITQACAELERLMPGIRVVCFGHVGDGNLHFNQSPPPGMTPSDFRARESEVHDVVHGLAARMGGSISAEHGIGRLKQADFLRYESPLALELMARIKHAIDPQNLFNPGRVLPRQAVQSVS